MDNSTVLWNWKTSNVSEDTSFRPPSPYQDWYPWIATISSLMLLSGIPGNLLTIVAYMKFDELHTPTNFLILNQSIVDLFTCLTTPSYVFFNYTLLGLRFSTANKYACLFSLYLVVVSFQSSITNVLVLSTERFIAVFFSLEYYQWVTDRSVRVVVIGTWSVLISINCLPLFGLNNWETGILCKATLIYQKAWFRYANFLPSLLCLLICAVQNILIGISAVQKQRATAPVTSAALETAPDGVQRQEDEAQKKLKNQFKVTRMLLLVVGLFYLCWMPFMVFYGVMVSPPEAWQQTGVPKAVGVVVELSRSLLCLNTFVNPLIYGFNNAVFRKAYYKLAGIKLREENDSH